MRQFAGDVIGGTVGALMITPIILSCGVVSYQSLGPAYVSAGIMAAFVAAIFSTVIACLFGGPPLHVSSPKTSHAVILSSLIAVIATHHSFTDFYTGEAAPKALMVICFITLFISGLTQMLLGALRLGAFVKFVPYPVLAGIINGFALQIILGQMPNAFGVENSGQIWQQLTGRLPSSWWPLGFFVFTAALTAFSGRVSKSVPPPLVGLIGGTLAYIIAANYIGISPLGPVIGKLPTGISFVPQIEDFFNVIPGHSFQRHAFLIIATGVTLAFISSIQSLLSISHADELFGVRHNSNKELVVQGAANMAAAVFGGAPSGGTPNVTRAVHANGGRTRYANLMIGVSLLVLSYELTDVIARIPLSVMAGVVIATTVAAMDSWTHQLLRKIGTSSAVSGRTDILVILAVVILVAALVVLQGVLAALGVGMALALLIFLYRANATVVRRVMYADQIMSRTDRPMSAINALLKEPRRIAVIDLDGPLFFGNVETVARRIEVEMRSADWIILSFKRSTVIDSSGALTLKRLDKAMNKEGKKLLLAYLPAGGFRREFLRNVGVGGIESNGQIFEDVDSAMACAENELLNRLGMSDQIGAEKVLTEFEVLADLTEDQMADITSRSEKRSYAAGDCIIKEGTEDHSLYFLTSGRVSVFTRVEGRLLRLATYSAGVDVMFGELAIVTGATRSADIRADTQTTVLKLTCEAFEQLCVDSPMVATKLMRRMIVHTSSRLIRMTQLVRELES
ncbi:MAG: SulP family inorganic anion transporter [Gallionella sp.]